ncbi:MAG TPA: phosphohistidine phosphatase SixA [Acidobacteriota bacterium]
MDIYIIRHAIAEDKGGKADEVRALTEEGKEKMKEAAKGFARLAPEIDIIFSSPLVRARQTAEIVNSLLKTKVEEMKELSPEFDPEQVCARLGSIKKANSVALVGHEPNCSELMSYLLHGSSGLMIEFKKGGISLLQSDDLSAGSGILILHLSAKALRLMAG